VFSRLKRLVSGRSVSVATPVTYACELGAGSVLHPTAVVYNLGLPSNVRIGSDTHISGVLQVFADSGVIQIGSSCFLGDNSRIICADRVQIGDRVQIAHNCTIFDNDVHSLNAELRHREYLSNITGGQRNLTGIPTKPVVIEDDVWIAAHCIILKGARIGAGAVIGAGSLVTGDIPPMVLAYGNPARVVRSLV
jgi:acetyltransferase-like isoleucine patch superfamily enzyme